MDPAHSPSRPGPTRPSPPTPPPLDADRSASSSTASAAGSEAFSADPGPAFDPGASPAAPELDIDDLAVEEIRWEESQIRDALVLQGELAHGLVEWRTGLEETELWLHTDQDLRAIAPPLTRILNRYDVTRAAAAAGDEALLGAAFLRYGTRNMIRTRRALARRAAQPPQPVSGRGAEPQTGPEHDPEWQATHADDPFANRPPDLTPRRP
jgi:hypothetical protein